MNRSQTKVFPIFFSLILFSFTGAALGIQGDPPPAWPWKGVTMNQNATGPQDIDLLVKSLDVNSIRLTLRPRSLALKQKLSPEQAWKATLDWTAAMLDRCKQHHLVGIISMSQFPIDPALGIKQTSPKFWRDPEQLNQVVQLTADLAKRFKDRGPELGAYQIINEPLVRGTGAQRPGNWPDLIRRIVAAIRNHDPQRYVCVAAGPGGTPDGIRTFQPLSDKHLIYTAHMYLPLAYTHQGVNGRRHGSSYPGQARGRFLDRRFIDRAFENLRLFSKQHHALVYISEFSAVRWAPGAEQYLLDVVDAMLANRWAFSYHSWGGYHAWSPFYGPDDRADRPDARVRHFRGRMTPRFQTLQRIFNTNDISGPHANPKQ